MTALRSLKRTLIRSRLRGNDAFLLPVCPNPPLRARARAKYRCPPRLW